MCLPQPVRLLTDGLHAARAHAVSPTPAPTTTTRLARRAGDAVAGRSRATRRGGIGVRVLGRAAHKRPAAQELGAALGLDGVVARRLQPSDLRPVFLQLRAEPGDALEGLLLLCRVELLLGELVVLVERPGEGGQAGREGAEGRRGEGRGRR